MTPSRKRTILRSVHILFALPLLGYIYGPPEETMQYLPYFRYIYLPVVMVTGLWMWKGQAIGRCFTWGPQSRT